MEQYFYYAIVASQVQLFFIFLNELGPQVVKSQQGRA